MIGGNDFIMGGPGNDTVWGDYISGQQGIDRVYGGSDTIYADDGDDLIYGDRLDGDTNDFGKGGNDTIITRDGIVDNDRVDGDYILTGTKISGLNRCSTDPDITTNCQLNT
ncbi:MAG: hypothetical protein NZ517_07365 [Candidatus Nitrosocaldus sp.]|nr:hypothetical protein [Candidatus Nitrosocaldus sp.]